MLIRRVLSGQGGAPGSSFGNRIHREDLARLIVHCLHLDEQGEAVPPTLLAADGDTTPTYEVERWLAEKIGRYAQRNTATGDLKSQSSVSKRVTQRDRLHADLPVMARGLCSGHQRLATNNRWVLTA